MLKYFDVNSCTFNFCAKYSISKPRKPEGTNCKTKTILDSFKG